MSRFLFALGNSSAANVIAIYSFYARVVGALIQIEPLVGRRGSVLVEQSKPQWPIPASLPPQSSLSISVILPVYNESSIIRDNIKRIKTDLDKLGLPYEILICDDHSNDGMESHGESLSSESVSYLRFSKRIGKGGTIKNVIRYCNGNAIVLLDADVPISYNELLAGISLLNSGRKLVVGARRSRPRTATSRRALSIGFNTLMNILFKTGIKDHQCGFKIIDGTVARILSSTIRSDHFMFDAELIVNAKYHGIPVGVVEVDWLEHRSDGNSKVSSPRVILTMLADLALLRLRFLGPKSLLRLREMDAGSFTNVETRKCFPAQITVIDTNHSRVMEKLRKLYLTVAFSV